MKNAATRKYFDQGWLWYFPPVDVMMQLVAHANRFGDPTGRPYFSFDSTTPVSAAEWAATRSVWHHEHGVTNVWDRPPLRNAERYRGSMRRSAPRTHKPTKLSASHLNQKPLDLMERCINATTNPSDVVWEPFGGLCSASVAAVRLGRTAFSAEPNADFYQLAYERLSS